MLPKRILLSVCLIAMPVGACTLSMEGDGAVPEPAIEAPEMNSFWAAHAAHRLSGDLDAATSILAEDCLLFEPFQPPITGRENIALMMKQALAMMEIHHVSFESQDVYHHGDWLVDFGTFSETLSLHGKQDQHMLEGNYAAVLGLNADLEWKVKRFMALPSKPLPPELMEQTK